MSHPHDEAAVLGIKRIFVMSTEVETSLTNQVSCRRDNVTALAFWSAAVICRSTAIAFIDKDGLENAISSKA
jgi:hypothetical protein